MAPLSHTDNLHSPSDENSDSKTVRGLENPATRRLPMLKLRCTPFALSLANETNISPSIDPQQLGYRLIALLCRRLESGRVAALGVDVGPAVHKRTDHRLVSQICRRVECVAVFAALSVGIGPAVKVSAS
jgi:hypothetical protein